MKSACCVAGWGHFILCHYSPWGKHLHQGSRDRRWLQKILAQWISSEMKTEATGRRWTYIQESTSRHIGLGKEETRNKIIANETTDIYLDCYLLDPKEVISSCLDFCKLVIISTHTHRENKIVDNRWEKEGGEAKQGYRIKRYKPPYIKDKSNKDTLYSGGK